MIRPFFPALPAHPKNAHSLPSVGPPAIARTPSALTRVPHHYGGGLFLAFPPPHPSATTSPCSYVPKATSPHYLTLSHREA